MAIGVFSVVLTDASEARAGSPPVIDALTASAPSVVPGGTVQVAVRAHDPDCTGTCTSGCGQYVRADLTVWSAAVGSFVSKSNGTSASPYSASADWQAPTVEGTYAVAVTLSDSGTFMCGGRNSVSGQLNVLVTASTNRPPVVTALTASPTRLLPGQVAKLECQASDPDGDPVAYAWSTDVGTLSASGATATFTGSQPGIAVITCTATDGKGASASGTTNVAVTDALAERSLRQDVDTPLRVAVDSLGDVYVADRGGITVLNLADGALLYRIPIDAVRSVAVDWQNRLLVGGASGARLLDRRGQAVLTLDPGQPLGAVADVAVDTTRRRYAVLHGDASRVVVYDEAGAPIGAVGVPGDGPSELRRPQGIAFTPGGDLVVADSGHATIKVVGLDGTLRVSFAGNGTGAGRFVRLDDVEVGADGVIYASDAYQAWVQAFNPDGTLRDVVGTYGDGLGQFKTPSGIAVASDSRELIVASLNTPSLEVFRTKGDPVTARLPKPALSATALVFPQTTVGTASRAQNVVLSNVGDAPLGIHRIAVNGEFSQANDCGLVLDPGTACTFALTYVPEATGAGTGALRIETSATPSVQTVTLAGDAVAPPSAAASLSPDHLVFDGQRVGTTSAPQIATLRNTGGVPVLVRGVRIGQGFGLAHDCGASLPVGGGCTLSLSFAPSSIGPVTGTLTVETDAVAGSLFVTLSGRGLARGLQATPDSIDFGRQTVRLRTKPRLVTIVADGPAPIAITAVEIAGADPEQFLLARDACSGATVTAGTTSCTVRVRFRPRAEGLFSASLRVTVATGERQDLVALRGEGVARERRERIFEDDFESGDLSRWTTVVPPQPIVELRSDPRPGSVLVGDVRPGDTGFMNVRVVNATEEPARLSSVTVHGTAADRFQIDASGCLDARLEAGGSCTLRISFSPLADGRATAEVEILGSAGSTVLVVAGEGRAPDDPRRP